MSTAPNFTMATPAPPNANLAAATSTLNKSKEYVLSVLAKGKPWAEMFDKNAVSKPANLGEAVTRMRKNSSYFKLNYVAIILCTTILSFLMHPGSLIVLALILASWAFAFLAYPGTVEINGKSFSEREKIVAMSVLSFVLIFFVTSVGTVFFSAISISLALIALHGAFREPDNLFLDDGEAQSPINPFSFLPIPISTPAVATNV
uniref:PRA1 family protein n=2 Tax=Polytomella parva TaxID=51329 RepID=A0A7S0VCP1_9CHLO|mmetsp:Transcript_29681/g.54426  ORF Transcript_29681/g.54426 Transcript_29681/m.54426 type:complete len:204 (+) Transcript_29681:73-684(+)|eukprot:CAMPEP_0175062414 /NCGR_PEP_ID=MMETSP0052_2-20121109/14154_1 /TAXON_ID=51329 ORGANISM="Polytomella parva, Strain SAG 63-3" /NCGR_SAMPLE_ID=MMETSP0052_2 /ASSEMBLY_ACC=CAM_ASM_000194 /LENGTH=203 /DNA_ID=CAMNT_0016328431 /DNA_START=73 /DNA_END=684 /DNA_ORIENTATION=+